MVSVVHTVRQQNRWAAVIYIVTSNNKLRTETDFPQTPYDLISHGIMSIDYSRSTILRNGVEEKIIMYVEPLDSVNVFDLIGGSIIGIGRPSQTDSSILNIYIDLFCFS